MNKEQYLAFHKTCCEKMIEITAAKNADYCGVGEDPFANFSRVEALGITDTARGFLVRMTDKLSRVTSFVQKGILLVKDESVEDSLLDLANYCILMAGYLKSKRNEEETLKTIEKIQGKNTIRLSKEEYEKLLNNQVSKHQDTDNLSDVKTFIEREMYLTKDQVAANLPYDELAKPFPCDQQVKPLYDSKGLY